MERFGDWADDVVKHLQASKAIMETCICNDTGRMATPEEVNIQLGKVVRAILEHREKQEMLFLLDMEAADAMDIELLETAHGAAKRERR